MDAVTGEVSICAVDGNRDDRRIQLGEHVAAGVEASRRLIEQANDERRTVSVRIKRAGGLGDDLRRKV